MKKFLAFILALACALSLMACGKKNNDDKPDPDPAPDPQPTVITAEFTHGYVDMALDLPEGWSWEQVSDNGTDKTEGIRFYKTDDPTVSYTLLCWTGGYGICGTGVTSEEITLANGMKVWQHTEEDTEKGTMVMADIFFEDVPGSYVASPSETMTTEVWNANRDALLSILGTAQIGRKSVSQQAAIDAANAYAVTQYGVVTDSGLTLDNSAYRFPAAVPVDASQETLEAKARDMVDFTFRQLMMQAGRDSVADAGFHCNVCIVEDGESLLIYVLYD